MAEIEHFSSDIRWSHDGSFRLDESQLRRICQLCRDRCEAETLQRLEERFYVDTTDGTQFQFDTIDEVLQVENGGRYSVTELELSYEVFADPISNELESGEAKSAGKVNSVEEIDPRTSDLPLKVATVRFVSMTSLGSFSVGNGPTATVHVQGESRDWTLRFADELKERVARVDSHNRVITWLFKRTTAFVIAFPLVILGMALSLLYTPTRGASLAKELGALDPNASLAEIVAAAEGSATKVPPIAGAVLVLFVVAFGFIFGLHRRIISLLYPPGIFYWGDRMGQIDRIEGRRGKLFWGGLVAFIASVVASIAILPFS